LKRKIKPFTQNYLQVLAIGFTFILAAFLIAVVPLLPGRIVERSGMLLANLAIFVAALAMGYRSLCKKTISGVCTCLIFTSFSVTYPLSGVIHLIRPTVAFRGFFDLIYDAPDLIGYCTLLVFLAFVALSVGMNDTCAVSHDQEPIKYSPPLLLVLGLLFTVTGLAANIPLFGSVGAAMKGVTIVNRSAEIGGGIARYYFVARWLAWGLFLIVCYALLQYKELKPRQITVLVGITALTALAGTFWSGGRSEGMLAALPIVLISARLAPTAYKQGMKLTGMMVLGYIVLVTILRTRGEFSNPVMGVLDWQAGRFSMVGLGLQMARSYGHDWGLVMLSPILQTLNSPFYLLRLGQPFHVPGAITNLAGLYLLGDPRKAGIVPGSICELAYSFGLLGVPVGYYILGRMVVFATNRIEHGRSIGEIMIAIYFIILVCISIIPGTMTTWIYCLATFGFPCILLYVLESF
jgi:hypothetical protein